MLWRTFSESHDDPHEFDRPEANNPFIFFGGPQPGQDSGHSAGGTGFDGGGPFANLLQQLVGTMGNVHQGSQGQYQQSPPNPSHPPAIPAQAAALAAERRAREGQPAANSSGRASPTSGVNTAPNAPRNYHGSGATFIWSSASGSNRPPPRTGSPSARSPSSPQMDSHPQQTQQGNVPIRNLASFLTEAFSGPGAVEQGHNVRQGQHIQDPTSSLQEGPTQQPNEQPGDMFTQMMHNLTGGAAVIMRNPQGQQQQLQIGGQEPQQQGTGTWSTGTTRIIFGNPGNGMAFSPGSGGTAGGPGGVLPFLPFIMMGGGSEGMPDRMGDFVFSQGAMDKQV